jgi:hypothetical protein
MTPKTLNIQLKSATNAVKEAQKVAEANQGLGAALVERIARLEVAVENQSKLLAELVDLTRRAVNAPRQGAPRQ